MTFSFGSMIRLLVLLAIGSTLLAIGVSRLVPPQPSRRYLQAVTSHNINDFFLRVPHRRSLWMDAESGAISKAPIGEDEILEAASCSPWVDETGQRQVVGLWSNRTFRGPSTLCNAVGLARYTFPGGQLLDQVPSEVFPVGPPCWMPGIRARVVFAGGDGRLYRFAFEPDGPLADSDERRKPVDSRPTPLEWACPKPGTGNVLVGDISWPEDPRMQGRMVVSLQLCEATDTQPVRFSEMQIWWLKLNHSATQIIEAGPMFAHKANEPRGQGTGARSPVVASLPDGSLGLAYTRETLAGVDWSVHLARVEFTADHRPIAAVESQTRLIATRCRPSPLAFSTDGRWINALTVDSVPDKPAARFSTTAPSQVALDVATRGQ